MDTNEAAPLFATEALGEPDSETADVVLGEARELVRRLEHELTEVEHAVARLEDGSYGQCDICGARVEPSQLVEDPTAHRCVQHLAATNS